MGKAIQKGSAVYIRYLEHVLNRTIPDAAVRETMGWLTQEIGDFVFIQHDRTLESVQYSSGSAKGIIFRKSCILEICVCEKGERVEAGSAIDH